MPSTRGASSTRARPWDSLSRCARCGACQGACPLYLETRREELSARGRVTLLEALARGELDWGRPVAELLACCLLCGRCEEVCSVGLGLVEAFLEARPRVAAHGGIGTRARLWGLLVRHPWLLRGGLWALGRAADERGLWTRLSGLPPRALLPARAARLPTRGGRAALFLGCAFGLIGGWVAEATGRLLRAVGMSASAPEGQTCCGLMACALGDLETARRLARRNVEALEGEGPVVVPCASCRWQLRRYPALLEGEERARAERLAARVRSPQELLGERLPEGLRPPGGERLVYHRACHERSEPWPLAGLGEVDRCCGMGGSFGASHPELARRVLARLLAELEGAEAVITGCGGCWLQLRGHWPGRVLHPVELIAEALEASHEGEGSDPGERHRAGRGLSVVRGG